MWKKSKVCAIRSSTWEWWRNKMSWKYEVKRKNWIKGRCEKKMKCSQSEVQLENGIKIIDEKSKVWKVLFDVMVGVMMIRFVDDDWMVWMVNFHYDYLWNSCGLLVWLIRLILTCWDGPRVNFNNLATQIFVPQNCSRSVIKYSVAFLQKLSFVFLRDLSQTTSSLFIKLHSYF